jgi:DNA-directed RNA polymerase specialized sigma24 family protein
LRAAYLEQFDADYQLDDRLWSSSMAGPLPLYRPTFPEHFLAKAQRLAGARTTASHLRQRARLVLLLQELPLLSNAEAADRIDLHPNSIRRWRQRWAKGCFSLEDDAGRGRKPVFFPPGSGHDRLHGL